MRKMFTESQLNKIVEMMSYTSSQIQNLINNVIGDIALQGKISDYKIFLFAPDMRVVGNKFYVNAPNMSVSNNSLIIL